MKKLVACIFFITLLFLVSGQQGDALSVYRSARDLESSGKIKEANLLYEQASSVLALELKNNPRNMDSYVVYSWVLFRLKKYQETINISLEGLKINQHEYRLMESAGEAYFYLDNYSDSLRYFEQYLAGLPNGDRSATAFFFLGEIYRLTNKFEHADIAYSTAVYKEKNIALWWYRLGLARERAESKNSAKAAFERALLLQPNYSEAKDALLRVS